MKSTLFIAATVASGQGLSSTIDLNGQTLEAIICPAALTSTAVRFNAAPPKTQGDASLPSSTFQPLVNTSGTDYEVTVAASDYVILDHDVFVGVRWLQLAFQSNEAATRTIILAVNRDR